MNPTRDTYIEDPVAAMRYGMEQGLRDLKWNEVAAAVPGEVAYLSPGNEVQFTMSVYGTHWAFGYDNGEGDDAVYNTFAEGDTWIEFERALLLAQAIEEEKLGTRQDLIGKWYDSWIVGQSSSQILAGRGDRKHWFRSRGRYIHAPLYTADAWRALTGHERETIEQEVLKGICE